MGVDAVDESGADIGPRAFYGRCSTEDNQDPETSRAWQFNNATKFVQPLGGHIAAEFFDIGQSRSVPWERREAASALLHQLRDEARGWTGIVVGEGTRCWFGNQFSLTAPRFEAYGLDIWVPELGGRFDSRNASHKMLMSVLGGMSESERQHVQARVRAAMDAQVVNEGRHQGARALRLHRGRRWSASESEKGGRGPSSSLTGCRRAVSGSRSAYLRGVPGRSGRPGNRGRAESRRDPLPVCPPPGAEPSPISRRAAGQHGTCNPRESSVHRLRGVRSLDEARDAARPR